MKNTEEIIRASKQLGIKYKILPKNESIDIIKKSLTKFNVVKASGHLSISNQAISIPTEKYEFTYSHYLINEPVYIFFDQLGFDRNTVIEIESGKKISEIMENSFGMEYFLTNQKLTYLIAVNWYVIEGVGIVENWLTTLTLG